MYKNTSFDKEEEILANHNSFMSSMNSQFDEKNDDVSIAYWIPKSTSIYIEKGILLDLLRTVYNYDYFVCSHTEDTIILWQSLFSSSINHMWTLKTWIILHVLILKLFLKFNLSTYLTLISTLYNSWSPAFKKNLSKRNHSQGILHYKW